MDERELGVHASHCCVMHGCKYGEKDCPVVNDVVEQKYVCETCSDYEGIQNLEDLKEHLQLYQEVEELQKKIEQCEKEGQETIAIPVHLLKAIVDRKIKLT